LDSESHAELRQQKTCIHGIHGLQAVKLTTSENRWFGIAAVGKSGHGTARP
jgi:hypothetical protein